MSHSEEGNTVSLGTDEVEIVDELPEITRVEQEGRRIGRYELVYELGTGGMANVYLARARGPAGFHKWFAIKRIHPHLAKEKRFVRMFLDEARIAAAVQHPNVAHVFDLGEEEGEHYIAMEYLHGEHLGALIVRAVREWGRLPPQLAAAVVARAADGLHHAHEVKDPQGKPLGLVHRDVSPHNIFITYDGQVKITDFGVAKAGNRLTNTQTGTLKGKLAYLSPEQALGQTVDRRADIFSLGVVLWEITTGRRLFKAETDAQTLMRVTSGRIRAPSEVVPDYPQQLEHIVLRALASSPDQRYASAAAMARDLDRYVASTGEPAGATELSASMHQLFPDRMVAKDEILRSEPGTVTATAVPETPRGADASSGSGALPYTESSSKIVAKTESGASAPPQRAKGRLAAILSAAVVALGALAAGGVWLLGGPDTSVVRIDTRPAGATVVLDGRRRGSSPVLLEQVQRGEHTLRLEREGLDPHETSFEATGDRVNLMYDLGAPPESKDEAADSQEEATESEAPEEPAPSAAEPDGDGEGSTDRAGGDEAGSEQAGAATSDTATGDETGDGSGDEAEAASEQTAAGGDRDGSGSREERARRARPGYVSVLTRPWSKVWINGRFAGTTPLRPQRVRAGVVTLELQAEGKGPKKTVRLRVRPGQTVPYSSDL